MTWSKQTINKHLAAAEAEARVHEHFAKLHSADAEFLRKIRIPALKEMLDE